jgi:hypothetical protein
MTAPWVLVYRRNNLTIDERIEFLVQSTESLHASLQELHGSTQGLQGMAQSALALAKEHTAQLEKDGQHILAIAQAVERLTGIVEGHGKRLDDLEGK